MDCDCGVIYTGWASHCDFAPYTGCIIGYNASTLLRVSVLNVGTFDDTLDADGFLDKGDYGNGFLKLSTADNKLTVVDYFTMHNTDQESGADQDFGSGGAMSCRT